MQTVAPFFFATLVVGAMGLPAQADRDSGWIREDIQKGYQLAKKTGKPLLVVFR